MDFFERQHQAKSETKKLVALFVLAVLLIIALLNGLGFYVVNLSQEYQISLKDWLLSPISLGIAAGTILTIFIGSLFRYWQVRGGGQAVAEKVAGR
ncbi:MAG: peptidase M48 Ste24p, partial [Gammaproteobacteria bacterium]